MRIGLPERAIRPDAGTPPCARTLFPRPFKAYGVHDVKYPWFRIGAVAAVLIGGTAAGVHLGRSSVAEIDPVHFADSGPVRFFADLSPAGYGAVTPVEEFDPYGYAPPTLSGAEAGPPFVGAQPWPAVEPEHALAEPAPEQDDHDDWPEEPHAEREFELQPYLDFPITTEEPREAEREAAEARLRRQVSPAMPEIESGLPETVGM